jgi:hypothetical protein
LLGYAALVGLMAYTYYFTVFMVATQALAALLVAPRRFARLALAYGAALLAFAPWLTVIPHQLVLESERAGRGSTVSLSNIGKFAATQATTWETVSEFVVTYTANQPAFTILLVALAFMVGARHGRTFAMTVLWFFGTVLLFWGVNMVIPVYALRYTLMIVPALALLVGVAVERLPAYRPGMIALVGCLGFIIHSNAFLEPKPPHRELMAMLSAGYQPGDRIWYNLDYGALGSTLQFERAYYLEHEAPNLSTDYFVWDAPRDFEDVEITPRVWDVRPYWVPMADGVREVLLNGRAQSEEYRLGAYFLRLYEAPPDEPPVTFSDLLALEITPEPQPVYRPGDTVRLKTWWRALDVVPLDYSYGLYLRDGNGAVLTQSDQGLQIGDAPTSQWQPSSAYGLAMPSLTLPASLSPGEYGLWMATYYWEDPRPLPVSAPDGYVVDADAPLVRVAQITVQ